MRGTMKAGTWGGRRFRAKIKSREAEEKEREKFIQKGLADLNIGRKIQTKPATGGRLPPRYAPRYDAVGAYDEERFNLGEMERSLLNEYSGQAYPTAYRDVGSNLLTDAQVGRRREIQQAVGTIPKFIDPSKREEQRDYLSRQFDLAIAEERETKLGRTRFDGVIVPPIADAGFDDEALVEQAQGVAPAQMIEDDEGNIIGEEYGTEQPVIGQGALAVQQPAMDVVETYEPETKPDVYERWKAQKEAKAKMASEATRVRPAGDELSDMMGGLVVETKLERELNRRGIMPEATKFRPASKDLSDEFSRTMVAVRQMGAQKRLEQIGGRADDLAKELEQKLNIDLSKPSGERTNPALVGLNPNKLKQSTLGMVFNPTESARDRRKRLAGEGKLSIVQLGESERKIAPSKPPLAGEGDAPSTIKIRAKEGEGTQSLIYGREQYGAVGRTRPLGLYDQGLVDAQKKMKTKTILSFVDAEGKPVPKEVWSKLKPKERKEKYGEKKRVKVQVEGEGGKIDPYFGGARGIHQIEKKKATKRREARTKNLLYLKKLQEEDPEAFYDKAVQFDYGAHKGRVVSSVEAEREKILARPQSTATQVQPALHYSGDIQQVAPSGYVPFSYAGGDLPTGEALDREFIKDEAVRQRVDEEIREEKSTSWMPKGTIKKKKKKKLPSGLAKLAKGL